MSDQRILRRANTGDRGPPERVEILTTEQLGPNMSKTPNGNLICKAVPIARVGWMVYGPGETPIEVGRDGIAHVYRGEDELFKPDCVGSFMGAAVVDEHPEDDVTPKNWKELSQGFATTNVYRGSGADADVLMADLIVTDEELITSILGGKREVSCGYDADYEQTGDGEGKQTNIIGNHIALVERGRCGPRCAIGDQEYQRKEIQMTTKVTVKTVDKRAQVRANLRKAFRDAEAVMGGDPYADDSQTDEGMAEGGDGDEGGTHIHIHTGSPEGKVTAPGEDEAEDDTGDLGDDPIESRFQSLEASIVALTEAVTKLAEGGQAETVDSDGPDPADDGETQDDGETMEEEVIPKNTPAKTADSAALETGYKAMLAKAEILVPGFRMPTFDSKAQRRTTIDGMCKARRKVLDLAYSTLDGKGLLDAVAGRSGLNLAKMECTGVAQLFNSAAGAKSLLNNRQATGDSGRIPELTTMSTSQAGKSIAEVNKANADFWAAKAPKIS